MLFSKELTTGTLVVVGLDGWFRWLVMMVMKTLLSAGPVCDDVTIWTSS